eukprot:GHVQ01028184.1.p1 GENE.GHVQ01028184.1~~GHVQ01028184.1.p1  ORF type:complete len:509 (+),score=55.44 GHVQ01028184.1:1-1527(+)
MYFLKGYSLSHFAPSLLDESNPSSIVGILSLASDVHICLDPMSFAEASGTKDKELLRTGFHRGLETLRYILSVGIPNILNTVPLAHVLRLCIMYARKAIADRQFGIEYGYLQYGVVFNYNLPIARLLLNGMLQPVLESPEYFCDRCNMSPPSNPSTINSMRTISQVLIMSMNDTTYSNIGIAHILKDIMLQAQTALVESVTSQADVEDTLDTELTLDLYKSHLDMHDSVVTLKTDDIAVFINMLKKYEAKLNLSSFDPVAKLITKISGDDRKVPFTRNEVDELRQSPTWHAFKMNHRFLLTEKNLVFCPITRAPVPQRLAPRQQAYVKSGQTLMSLVVRHIPPDEYDPRLVLQKALREVPPINAKDWPKLNEELLAFADMYTARHPPDYKAAHRATLGASVAADMGEGGVSVLDVQRWMGTQIKDRKKHRTYLKHIQMGEDSIDEAEREYRYRSKLRMEQLQTAVEFAKLGQKGQLRQPRSGLFDPANVWSMSAATSTPERLRERTAA